MFLNLTTVFAAKSAKKYPPAKSTTPLFFRRSLARLTFWTDFFYGLFLKNKWISVGFAELVERYKQAFSGAATFAACLVSATVLFLKNTAFDA